MATLLDVPKSVGASTAPAIKPVILAGGALVSRNLDRAQTFYEDVLGLECVRVSPDRLLARHRNANKENYWVLDVRQVETIERPQTTCNHWGLFVRTREEVDRASEFAMKNKERYGLHRVQKPMANHGSYSFYIVDLDTNWWEIECRPEERSYGTDVAGGDRFVEAGA